MLSWDFQLILSFTTSNLKNFLSENANYASTVITKNKCSSLRLVSKLKLQYFSHQICIIALSSSCKRVIISKRCANNLRSNNNWNYARDVQGLTWSELHSSIRGGFVMQQMTQKHLICDANDRCAVQLKALQSFLRCCWFQAATNSLRRASWCMSMPPNVISLSPTHISSSLCSQELDILTLAESDGSINDRNKRTIGILRELFPELSKVSISN